MRLNRSVLPPLPPPTPPPPPTITTLLPGASPEEIESQVTKPIEEVVNTISGLDELRSSTIEGQSQVFATFVLERNVQEAANDVREKVALIREGRVTKAMLEERARELDVEGRSHMTKDELLAAIEAATGEDGRAR